jgi:hypothetical protein
MGDGAADRHEPRQGGHEGIPYFDNGDGSEERSVNNRENVLYTTGSARNVMQIKKFETLCYLWEMDDWRDVSDCV